MFSSRSIRKTVAPIFAFIVLTTYLLCLITMAAAQGNSPTSYKTNFPLSENPISEKNHWINGRNGGAWTDVRTTPGLASGTQDGSGQRDDSTAVLKGKWASDQSAEAKVSVNNKTGVQEAQLHLRTTIAPQRITGYSVNFSLGSSDNVQILRWNGSINNSTNLVSTDKFPIANGDTVKASISGNKITVFLNGQQILETTDSTFSSGSPGMGFFIANGGANENFGLSNFSATSGSGTAKAASTATPLASAGTSGNYTTNFPLTENPISEGGKWINGLTTGLKWANVRTTPGFAFGTQSGNVNFDDSTAVLTGTWGPDQTAQATVRVVQGDSGVFEEVELRLRSTITANSNTGYEINCSVIANNPYVQIVRWNGPLGSFTELDGRGTTGCKDGDILKATIVGSTITAYKNGTAVFSVTDSTFTSGSPGIGFYIQGGTSTLNPHFGFSNFTASDGSSTTTPPNPPTGLTAAPH